MDRALSRVAIRKGGLGGVNALGPLCSNGDDHILLERVLAPYKPHSRYLRRASLEPGDTGGQPLRGSGAFAIPEPCSFGSP